eukprot:1528488-Rhodomonas_salina.2
MLCARYQSSYALAMRCPVLELWRRGGDLPITLRACYAVSGTDIAYAAPRREGQVGGNAVLGARVCCYALAMRYPVLTWLCCYAH